MVRRIFSLALCAGLLGAPLAVFAYESPGTPKGFVSDFAGVFAPNEMEGLETELASYARASGNEIAVVTIPSLGGDTIENFAEELFKEWGIGKEGKDNGALLLVARDDRTMRIEVGYGLEPELTDLESGAIIRDVITPAFRNGDYFAGVQNGVRAMEDAIGGTYAPSPQPSPSGSVNVDWFWVFFFVPLWLASVLGRSKSWWAGGVIGGVGGVVLGVVFGFLWSGVVAIALLVPLGLLFDFLVSRSYRRYRTMGGVPPWWLGGGHRSGGFGSGGFGGFGGGHSGGGGASGRW